MYLYYICSVGVYSRIKGQEIPLTAPGHQLCSESTALGVGLQILSTVYGKFLTADRCVKLLVLYRSAPFIGEEVGGRVEATSLFGRGCRVEDVEVAANNT